MGDRPASALPASRHARPADTIAADAARNCASFLFRPTVYQRDICLSDLSLCKLSGQFAMCLVIFRHRNQSAGGFVEPMNNTGTQFAAHAREIAKMVQQRIDQGAATTLALACS